MLYFFLFLSSEIIIGNNTDHNMVRINKNFQCPPNCTSCSGKNQCKLCDPSFRLYNGVCLLSCPNRTIDRKFYCEECDRSCLECSEYASKCTKCMDNYFKYKDQCLEKCPEGTLEYGKLCVENCPKGTFVKESSCINCSISCKECDDDSEKCIDCPTDKYLLDNQCIDKCPDGYYIDGNKCLHKCKPNQFLYHGFCYNNCPTGTFVNDKFCQECDPACVECHENPTTCTKCPLNLYLYDSQCVEKCNEDLYLYNNQCIQSCPINTFIDGKNCVNHCPKGKFGLNQICEKCDSSCESCENTSTSCIKCKDGTFLFNNKCINKCANGKLLYKNECVDDCPSGTYASDNICEFSNDYYNVAKTKKTIFSPKVEIILYCLAAILCLAIIITIVIKCIIYYC